MPKNLTVIAQVFVDIDRQCTVNRSMNEILMSYKRHFEEVHYIGPGIDEITRVPGISDGIYLSTFSSYAKPIRDRITYYFKYLFVKRRFRELIESGPADIVQLRIPSLFSMAAYPVVRELGLPLTTYIAGNWVTAFPANYQFPGNHLVARALDKLQQPIIRNSIAVTAGPVLANQYAKLVDCHPYFSTTHKKVFRRKISFPPNKLVFVGVLLPGKRVCDAIEVVGLFKKQGVYVSLTIVGDGVTRKQTEELVKEQKLSDQIFFQGQINDSESLKQVYLAADILVLPSISEGTPKVLAEAMAHGVAVIAVAGVGSNDSIIEHGRNGLLTPAKSPQAIADGIKLLRSSWETYSSIVDQGYAYAKERTLDKEVDKLWGFVNSKIKERNNLGL